MSNLSSISGLSCLFQIGGTYAKPVIFVPEVAIGAVGRIQVGGNLLVHFSSVIW